MRPNSLPVFITLTLFVSVTLLITACIAKPESPEELARQTDLERFNLNGPVKSLLIQEDINNKLYPQIRFEFDKQGYKTEMRYYKGGAPETITTYKNDLDNQTIEITRKDASGKTLSTQTVNLLERDVISDRFYFLSSYFDESKYNFMFETDNYGNLTQAEYFRKKVENPYRSQKIKTEHRDYTYYQTPTPTPEPEAEAEISGASTAIENSTEIIETSANEITELKPVDSDRVDTVDEDSANTGDQQSGEN